MSQSIQNDIDDINTSDFSQSIRSMDDHTFAQFIQSSFGSGGTAAASESVNGIASRGASQGIFSSTPKGFNKRISMASVRSSDSHDPFDDSLDGVLMNIQVDATENVEGGEESAVQCGQTVPEDTDNDEDANIDEARSDAGSQDGNASSSGSSTSSSSSEEETIGKLHEFGDYATYFTNKKAKQQKADKDYVEWEKKRRKGEPEVPPIFADCIIHVNGHTVPSINEIHRLVILHGGKFISYLNSKGAATHIICDRFTPRKRIQFKNYRVVKAKWITDSIEKGELLEWGDYRLIDNVDYGQQRLRLNKGTEESKEEDEDGDVLPQGDAKPTRQEVPLDLQVNHVNEAENENSFSIRDTLGVSQAKESVDDEGEEELDTTLFDMPPLTHSQVDEEQEHSLTQSGEAHLESLNQKESKKKRGLTLDAKHPDFLKHFFAYSRLHHLSAWKADLRAQFLKKILHPSSQEQRHANNRGPADPNAERIILHADFDCFFATASTLGRPDLHIDKDPIAVSHGGKTSDVASCNYVARKSGVRNGMWISEARKLCPSLILIGYDFDSYEKISNTLYDYLIDSGIFDSIFPVSIDEVLLDATSYVANETKNNGSKTADVVNSFVSKIRSDILRQTGCSISVGISKNVLLAKLSLRKAKPNGQYYIEEDIDAFLKDIPVRDLPGIGKSIVYKLVDELNKVEDEAVDVPLISHLVKIPEMRLKNIFGEKTGQKLYQFSRGIDDTSIDVRENSEALRRKSVSVDVNYGIRFDKVSQLDTFLMELSKELYRRLMHLSMCGSSVSLRLARKAPTAPINPPKHLGMGFCTFANKTAKFGVPTNDWGIIGSELKALYRMLNVPIEELRGVAITMTNLVDVDEMKKNRQRQLPFKQGKKEPVAIKPPIPPAEKIRPTSPKMEPANVEPPLELDWDVFEALPASIQAEIQQEIDRRGMKVSKEEPEKLSPLKSDLNPKLTSSTRPSPIKSSPTKAYMQQLIPQTDGKLEYTRVLGSPKKRSPSKRKLTSKSPSPSKRIKTSDTGDPFIEDPSLYDESMINELPSSIRDEVMKDLENKVKSKKMLAKTQPKSLTSEWLAREKRKDSIQEPLFQNKVTSLEELKVLLTGWVQSSIIQGGPHVDDLNMILDHLEELLQVQGNLLRCVTIYEFIKTRVDCEECIFKSRIGNDEFQDTDIAKEGFKEWKKIIVSSLQPVIRRYCMQNNIDIDL